jgi:hypothetical protein
MENRWALPCEKGLDLYQLALLRPIHSKRPTLDSKWLEYVSHNTKCFLDPKKKKKKKGLYKNTSSYLAIEVVDHLGYDLSLLATIRTSRSGSIHQKTLPKASSLQDHVMFVPFW